MVKTQENLSAEEKILAAARRVFFQRGYAGARMQDIADEAGMNKALLHYYFRTKEKLFEVIFKEALGKLLPRISEIFHSEHLDFFQKVEAFIHAYISMAMEHPFIPLFVLNELHSNADAFMQRMFPDLSQIPFKKVATDIQQAMNEGLIHPVEPPQLMLHMLSMSLFPFLARPMFQRVMNISDVNYQKLMEARKTEVTTFVIRSIKK